MCRGVPERSDQHSVGWAPFERLADRYDAWFETGKGRLVFQVEAKCLRDLLEEAPRPWLEVGVGTGRRFSTARNAAASWSRSRRSNGG